MDFATLTETQVEPIFEAFTALPEERQGAMKVNFQDINAAATDGGMPRGRTYGKVETGQAGPQPRPVG